MLRASLAEAAYQAHLDKLKLKESSWDDEILDLTVSNNAQRDMDIGKQEKEEIKFMF
jgi:hypothetical protein